MSTSAPPPPPAPAPLKVKIVTKDRRCAEQDVFDGMTIKDLLDTLEAEHDSVWFLGEKLSPDSLVMDVLSKTRRERHMYGVKLRVVPQQSIPYSLECKYGDKNRGSPQQQTTASTYPKRPTLQCDSEMTVDDLRRRVAQTLVPDGEFHVLYDHMKVWIKEGKNHRGDTSTSETNPAERHSQASNKSTAGRQYHPLPNEWKLSELGLPQETSIYLRAREIESIRVVLQSPTEPTYSFHIKGKLLNDTVKVIKEEVVRAWAGQIEGLTVDQLQLQLKHERTGSVFPLFDSQRLLQTNLSPGGNVLIASRRQSVKWPMARLTKESASLPKNSPVKRTASSRHVESVGFVQDKNQESSPVAPPSQEEAGLNLSASEAPKRTFGDDFAQLVQSKSRPVSHPVSASPVEREPALTTPELEVARDFTWKVCDELGEQKKITWSTVESWDMVKDSIAEMFGDLRGNEIELTWNGMVIDEGNRTTVVVSKRNKVFLAPRFRALFDAGDSNVKEGVLTVRPTFHDLHMKAWSLFRKNVRADGSRWRKYEMRISVDGNILSSSAQTSEIVKIIRRGAVFRCDCPRQQKETRKYSFVFPDEERAIELDYPMDITVADVINELAVECGQEAKSGGIELVRNGITFQKDDSWETATKGEVAGSVYMFVPLSMDEIYAMAAAW